MTDALISKIESKNHWWIEVRPAEYRPDRLAHSQLESVLSAIAVHSRGWPVPFVDSRVMPDRGDNWIGQNIDASTVDQYEAWRFTEAAQFTQLRAVSASWRTGSDATVRPRTHTGAVIEVWEILFYLTEVTLLAARLAADELGAQDEIEVIAHLRLVEDTQLVTGFSDLAPMQPKQGPRKLDQKVVRMTGEELVAAPGPAAIRLASQIFQRFGWNPTDQQLYVLQRRMYE